MLLQDLNPFSLSTLSCFKSNQTSIKTIVKILLPLYLVYSPEVVLDNTGLLHFLLSAVPSGCPKSAASHQVHLASKTFGGHQCSGSVIPGCLSVADAVSSHSDDSRRRLDS